MDIRQNIVIWFLNSKIWLKSYIDWGYILIFEISIIVTLKKRFFAW